MKVTWIPDPAIGVDIRLDIAADLAVTPGGDLDLVGNSVPMHNVWQATALRLSTTLGTYFFAEGYGTKLRRYIDQPVTTNLQQTIQTEINSTVLADPRVQKIQRLDVTPSTTPPGYVVRLDILTSSSQSIGGTLTITGA